MVRYIRRLSLSSKLKCHIKIKIHQNFSPSAAGYTGIRAVKVGIFEEPNTRSGTGIYIIPFFSGINTTNLGSMGDGGGRATAPGLVMVLLGLLSVVMFPVTPSFVAASAVRTLRRLDPVMERHFQIKTGQLNIPDASLADRTIEAPVQRTEEIGFGAGARRGKWNSGIPVFNSNARDIVVGMVWGVDADTSRFVRSWLWHAPNVRLILLVPSGEDYARKAYLRAWGVELRPWPNSFTNENGELKRFELYYDLLQEFQTFFGNKCVTEANAGAETDPGLGMAGTTLTCADEDFVINSRAQPYILLSDVRDVVVQSNPFEMARDVAPGKIIFSMEDSRVTLGACPFNSQWILELYGEDMLEDMADHRISCSGVTLGPLAEMLRYVRTMRHFTKQVLENNARSTKNIRKGSDQGIHNCVVHGFCRDKTGDFVDSGDDVSLILFDPKRDAVLLPNEASPVQNLGWVPWDGNSNLRERIDGLGRVRDSTGRVIPLLHQFDRHTELYQIVLGMYPWWNPTTSIAEAQRRSLKRQKEPRKERKNRKRKMKKKKNKKKNK